MYFWRSKKESSKDLKKDRLIDVIEYRRSTVGKLLSTLADVDGVPSQSFSKVTSLLAKSNILLVFDMSLL